MIPNTLLAFEVLMQETPYLQDHELLDYAVLSEKAAAASAHFNELSARIKAAETRMAEIAVLREHIVGYAKTRDTYVAYRKAGYSKKFLTEHESEITIHKSAKNYFDGLGLKKLPTIKALNTEYAELLAEKKAAYADYRKAREEMKELLTAKAKIRADRIFSSNVENVGDYTLNTEATILTATFNLKNENVVRPGLNVKVKLPNNWCCILCVVYKVLVVYNF